MTRENLTERLIVETGADLWRKRWGDRADTRRRINGPWPVDEIADEVAAGRIVDRDALGYG